MTKSDTPTPAASPPATPEERGRLTREMVAAQRALDRRKGKPRMPRVRLAEDKGAASVTLSYDHDDPVTATVLLMDAMGTGDERFAEELLSQVAKLGDHGRRVSEGATNFALSVVAAVEPRDALEAMLAAQMAAVHQATMMMARRLNHVETIAQQDAAERALNKLARTCAGQMETLKRYRSKGRQVVRVERVTVQEGGQAIVGHVEHGGRGADGKRREPHAKRARGPALRGPEQARGPALPCPRRERLAGLPYARGGGRRATRAGAWGVEAWRPLARRSAGAPARSRVGAPRAGGGIGCGRGAGRLRRGGDGPTPMGQDAAGRGRARARGGAPAGGGVENPSRAHQGPAASDGFNANAGFPRARRRQEERRRLGGGASKLGARAPRDRPHEALA